MPGEATGETGHAAVLSELGISGFETNFRTRGLELKLRQRESGENKTKLSLLSLSLSFNFESLSILYGSSEVHLFIPEKVHAKKSLFLPSIL